jgi:hypothetical protein
MVSNIKGIKMISLSVDVLKDIRKKDINFSEWIEKTYRKEFGMARNGKIKKSKDL